MKKSEIKAVVVALETEVNSIKDRTLGKYDIELQDHSKYNTKQLIEYKLYLEEEIKEVLESITEDVQKVQEIKEVVVNSGMDNLVESEENQESITLNTQGVISIDKRNQETRLIQCAIDNDLFNGTLWSQTGRVIEGEREKFIGSERKKMSKVFSDLLDSRVEASVIPETGPDRKGEIITLRKKSGAVKWSSWQVTARLVQNCSDIFKGIELLGYQVVFPAGLLISRSQLDKLLAELEEEKPKEEAYKTVQRCLETATKKLLEIENIEEIISCDDFIQTFMEGFREQLTLLKDAQKEQA